MVITRRSAGGIAAIWLAAVVGVSATAWVAIDRAGRDITNDIVSAMPSTPVITATTTPATTPRPSATSPKLSATYKPVATRKPAVKSKPQPVAVVTGPPVTPAPKAPASTAPPAPTQQVRTIVLQGGVVSVLCTGTAIELRLAQPEFDWNVLADDTSKAGTIYVTFFRTGEEDSQSRTLVSAVCANGVPAFKTNNVGTRND